MSSDYREKGRAIFLAALMVLSVVAMTASFAGSAAAATTTVRPEDSIQTAIDNADSGDTIELESGTYNQQITVDKNLTLVGAGPSSSGTVLDGENSGNGITVAASDVSVRNLRIENYSNGIRLEGTYSNIEFVDVYSVENNNRGMEIRNSADLQNLTLNSVNFSDNAGAGLRSATEASIDGFTVQNSHFDSNSDIGLEVYQHETNPGQLSNVVIQDTTFNNNGKKGIYTEKLSDAVLDNVTVDGVESDTYGFNTGIDINLKYNDYQNITIRNSEIANVSEGDPSDPSFSAAIAVKARDDGSYSGTPATLDNVTLNNIIVEDSFNGLRFGEPGVDYSTYNGPTNVTVVDSTFRNNDRYHLEDLSDSVDLATVFSSNTFDQTVTVEDSSGTLTSGIYGSIQPAVDAASSGATVTVGPSTYNESVTIDTKNVTLESTAGADETIVNGSNTVVDIGSDRVTLQGLKITGGTTGIHTSSNVDNTTISNLLIEDLSADGQVQGIWIERNSEHIVVKDTVIRNLDAGSYVQGIVVFGYEGNNVGTLEDLTFTNNTIENVSTDGDTAWGMQIKGNITGITLQDNVVRNIESPNWWHAGVTLTTKYAASGPRNVTMTENTFENAGIGINLDGNTSAESVSIHNNNIVNHSEYGISNVADGVVDATSNWWGATNGPSGDLNGNGSAVSGPITVDPATVNLDSGSVSLTQDFLGVVKDSQNVTLNGTSDATFSFDSESVPGDVDGTLVLGINGTDYVFEDVLDDGAINTSASGAEVDSGKNGTSIANTTPTGDTTITVVGNNSTTAVSDTGTIRLVHEVQNIGEGYTLTSLPQPAEVYTTDVSDFTSWSNADSNYDDSALSAGDGTLVDNSEALHKGQYANGESSDARIGYDYDTSGDRVNPGIEELNEGYNLVGSNYDISGSTVELNKDLSTTRNVPDSLEDYEGNESFAVYDPTSFGEVEGSYQVGNYEAYWVYVDTGEDSETRTIKVPKYDPAAS